MARLRGGEQSPLLVVMTKWRGDRVMASVVEDAVRGLGLEIAGRIPAQALVQRAAASRVPITKASPASAAGQAYEQLTYELLGARVKA